jgi:hypothetical protein
MSRLLPLTIACVTLSAACQREEKRPSIESAPAASASTRTVADKGIESALQEASKQAANAGGADAPPRDGILTLTRADAEALANAPAKVTLGSSGAEPRYKLTAGEFTQPIRGEIEVAIRTGPNAAMPTVLFKLKADTLKAASSEPTLARVRLDVVEAGLGSEQPGNIPPAIAQQVQLLKGSSFEYSAEHGKVIGPPKFTRAKNAPEDSELLLSAAGTALDAALLAFPDEPVGKDGFWLVTARGKFQGSDVVSYRMVKVTEASQNAFMLDINTRRYAVGNRLEMPGLEGTELIQYQSSDKGQVALVPGSLLPAQATLQQSVMALVNTERGRVPVQIEVQARLAFTVKPASN